jgi:hypothetical protein
MTSQSYRNVGLTQFLLATGFVIWLVFLPGTASHFAWPIDSRLSSMFLGTSFALRAFEGWLMWREPDWSRIRWMSWGTLAFLTFIFAATYWHLDLMNWTPFNIATIVWMIAYTAEPVVVPFVEPRGPDAQPARRPDSAKLSNDLQNLLTLIMVITAAVFGMFFINPAKFITNYWPWALSAFDARIASAFFAGILLWAARMKLAGGWSEIRLGIQGFILFFTAHFLVWVFNLATGQFDPPRTIAVWVYGVLMGLLAAVLWMFYFRHEKK